MDKMVSAKDIKIRTQKLDFIIKLANEIKTSSHPIRSCDPIQEWEKHPIVSQYLDDLSNREIVAAIDAAYANRGE